MSEKAGGHEQLTRRSSFRKSLAEIALPDEYLGQLEEKRRQLDESIHKYIAAKERDYKTYEKELRHQHRNAHGQDGSNGASRPRASPESAQGDARRDADGAVTTSPRRQSTSRQADKEDAGQGSGAQLDRAAVVGLKDQRVGLERDKDFVGVFTPTYLPAINDQILASSAPSAVTVVDRAEIRKPIHIERSNSDTLAQAKPKRPSQLALAHRTSSSGSSADGKLASAMKSPSQQSKRKRVSLAVGDSIVAPSDNVPAVPSRSNTPSHSRRRSADGDRHLSIHDSSGDVKDTESASTATEHSAQASLTSAEPGASVAVMEGTSAAEHSHPVANEALSSQQDRVGLSRLDPDGDLFDLEALENIPINQTDLDDLEEEALETADHPNIEQPDFGDQPPDTLLDSSTASIPISTNRTSSTIQPVAFAPSSAVASQQPIKPGFRRPSVAEDPVYVGQDYREAEEDAVENEVYGSSFNRPTSKGSFTAGSLGESFMAAHAAEMMARRGKQAVKS